MNFSSKKAWLDSRTVGTEMLPYGAWILCGLGLCHGLEMEYYTRTSVEPTTWTDAIFASYPSVSKIHCSVLCATNPGCFGFQLTSGSCSLGSANQLKYGHLHNNHVYMERTKLVDQTDANWIWGSWTGCTDCQDVEERSQTCEGVASFAGKDNCEFVPRQNETRPCPSSQCIGFGTISIQVANNPNAGVNNASGNYLTFNFCNNANVCCETGMVFGFSP
eukprot:maker-scaffold9_size846264-snap-gene-4.20 protein:Tk08394 transcript:maker-scaffold9_size846264-snap-gene-4.20-mRNA-1 annotation:"hypothetical protein"